MNILKIHITGTSMYKIIQYYISLKKIYFSLSWFAYSSFSDDMSWNSSSVPIAVYKLASLVTLVLLDKVNLFPDFETFFLESKLIF